MSGKTPVTREEQLAWMKADAESHQRMTAAKLRVDMIIGHNTHSYERILEITRAGKHLLIRVARVEDGREYTYSVQSQVKFEVRIAPLTEEDEGEDENA